MHKLTKDMKKVYAGFSTIDLIKLRGRKQLRLLQAKKLKGYFAAKEVRYWTEMIAQIDREIERRSTQDPFSKGF